MVPEPVIFKQFRLRFGLQPSGSTGSGTCSSSASLPLTTPLFSAFRTAIHSFVTGEPRDFIFGTLAYYSTSQPTCVTHLDLVKLSDDEIRTRGTKYKLIQRHCCYDLRKYNFYGAMLCIRGTSHGPVSVRPSVRPSVRHKSVFY